MNQTLQANNQTILEESIVDLCITFFMKKQFWFWHGLLLTISWFGISFLAVLVQKRFRSFKSKIVHTLLFIIGLLASLFANTGAIYKTYINWERYPKWGYLNKGHKLAGLIFTFVLLWQVVTGFQSLIWRRSRIHRKYGYWITYAGMFITLSGMLLMKQYNKTLIFSVVLIVQLLILEEVDVRAFMGRIFMYKSKGNSNPGKID